MRLLATMIVLLGLVTLVRAEPETKPVDKAPNTPKETLKAQDAAAKAGKIDDDLSVYKADDDAQKKLAKALARGDVALAKLQKAVDEKFGKDLSLQVAHAADAEDLVDIEAATEKVDGETATIEWKDGNTPPLQMVKDNGKWKVSLADMLQGLAPADVQKLTKSFEQMTTEMDHIRELVEKGKFRSGEGIRDRIKEIHDQLFNDDQDKEGHGVA